MDENTPNPEDESPTDSATANPDAGLGPEPDESLDTDQGVVLVAANSGEGSSKPAITFQGNSYDLTAVVGVTIGGVVLLTCASCNMGFYCLPFVPLLLGIVGLATAQDSIDPERTRLLSWISLGSGVAILLLIFLFIAAYVGFFIFIIAMENSGSF